MAKCIICGKKGLFLKVNEQGKCSECVERERIEQQIKERHARIEAEKKKAKERIEALSTFTIELSSEKRNRQTGYEEVKTSNITPKGHFDDFTVIDLETTGLAPSKDRIVEICAIKYSNYEPVSIFHTFINPERHVPEDATEINGITDDMLKNAPKMFEVLPSFEAFVGTDNLVGHNLQFDLKFLFYSGSTILDVKRKYFDTLEQAKRILKTPKMVYDKEYEVWEKDYESDYDVEDYKLETLCYYYDIKRYSEHRADADAMATGDLFITLVKEKQGEAY